MRPNSIRFLYDYSPSCIDAKYWLKEVQLQSTFTVGTIHLSSLLGQQYDLEGK